MSFWLKFIEVTVILLLGIYLIAFLEEKLVSGPRRRMVQRKIDEKLNRKPSAELKEEER
jgi:hypothetical protein